MNLARPRTPRPLHHFLVLAAVFIGISAATQVAMFRAARNPPVTPAAATLKFDPNTATAAELELLPGIGPALARNIIAFRENAPRRPAFRTPEDLLPIPRIGPATVEKLRPWLAFPADDPHPDLSTSGDRLVRSSGHGDRP